ncbi:Macrophage mannose receptor 1 [Nymphon striatum]|nr:Macrophage mannose receptor 1 [Nymphon striatum]
MYRVKLTLLLEYCYMDSTFGVNLTLNGDCVMMRKGETSAGKWKDTSCYNSKAYICERFKDPTLTEPQNEVEKCKKHKMFSKYRKNCYRVFDGKLKWEAARAACLKYNGDLASFHDVYGLAFVTTLMKDENKTHWIGLNNKQNILQLKWSSRFPVTFTSWGRTQLMSNLKKDSCVTTDKRGNWTVANCSSTAAYVCEIHNDEIPPLDEIVDGFCPEGWLDIGTKKCYLFVKTTKSWSGASFQCTKKGASLASFHKKSELIHVMKFLGYSIAKFTWIGLYKDFNGKRLLFISRVEGGYKWHDNSPVQYVNWQKSPTGYGDCVLVNSSSTAWFLKSCSYSYPYICMKDKNNTSGGLTGGQKAVIAVVIIVVICAAAAATFYFVKIKQRRQGMSDASHSFTFDNEMYNNNNL